MSRELSFCTQHKVEFFDVDSMNVMWHGNYVKIIESARCYFLENIGYDYKKMKEDGYVFPIVKMNFKYISPACFGDFLEVKTTLVDYDIFLEFSYELTQAKTQKKVALASTHQVAVKINDLSTQLAMPAQFLKAIQTYKDHL